MGRWRRELLTFTEAFQLFTEAIQLFRSRWHNPDALCGDLPSVYNWPPWWSRALGWRLAGTVAARGCHQLACVA